MERAEKKERRRSNGHVEHRVSFVRNQDDTRQQSYNSAPSPSPEPKSKLRKLIGRLRSSSLKSTNLPSSYEGERFTDGYRGAPTPEGMSATDRATETTTAFAPEGRTVPEVANLVRITPRAPEQVGSTTGDASMIAAEHPSQPLLPQPSPPPRHNPNVGSERAANTVHPPEGYEPSISTPGIVELHFPLDSYPKDATVPIFSNPAHPKDAVKRVSNPEEEATETSFTEQDGEPNRVSRNKHEGQSLGQRSDQGYSQDGSLYEGRPVTASITVPTSTVQGSAPKASTDSTRPPTSYPTTAMQKDLERGVVGGSEGEVSSGSKFKDDVL